MTISKTVLFPASNIKVGDRYWKLLILGFENRKKKHWTEVYALCKCECGKYISCKKNKIACWKTDCGCVTNIAQRNPLYNYPLSREDDIFHSKRYDMNRRCRERSKKPKSNCYQHISVERKNEKEFYNDMYDGFIEHVNRFWIKNTTLDRIDNNKNYCKENCRRATREEQYTNMKRATIVEINWKKFSPNMIAKECWISKDSARTRMKKYLNWDISLKQLISKKTK